jgi:hypothetical protein
MSSQDEARAPAKVGCPICGKPQKGQFRPFCSRRCADVDLHRWLSGVYAVPALEAEGDDLAGSEGSTDA